MSDLVALRRELKQLLEERYGDDALKHLRKFSAFQGKEGKEVSIGSWRYLEEYAKEGWVKKTLEKAKAAKDEPVEEPDVPF